MSNFFEDLANERQIKYLIAEIESAKKADPPFTKNECEGWLMDCVGSDYNIKDTAKLRELFHETVENNY